TPIDPKPRTIDVGPLPQEADMPAAPAALSALMATKTLDPEQRDAIKPLLAQLVRLRANMASSNKDTHKE
ncbi:MAG: MerR family transcriptional regulator, partial [Roseobacter sp.]